MNTINKPQSQISWNQLYSEVLAQDDLDRLNVAPQSSDQKINAQFRKLAIKYHPDKNKDFKETASKIFQLIIDSKEALLGIPVSDRLHRRQFVFQWQETEEEKEARRVWENMIARIDAETRIRFLSLYEARRELAHNSQSNIPGFDKANALREHIAYLEIQRANKICSKAGCALLLIFSYFYIKENLKARPNCLITKPSTPEVNFSKVSCNLS